MYPNPLIYCTCWDPWNLGPRKLIKTPRPPGKGTGKPNKHSLHGVKTLSGKQEECKELPYEEIDVSPGYHLFRNKEQISVTLGDEMFDRKKTLESATKGKNCFSHRTKDSVLEEQISELTAIIEQMNRDHKSAQTLLSSKMEMQCTKMQQKFEDKNRELEEAHAAELKELEKNYKEALKSERLAAQAKLDEKEKEYRFLKNMFHMYQDSIYDEMEDKWSKRKAEWEKDEKMERERILLQQKTKMRRQFEFESEEEKKKINESCKAMLENFNREKEKFMKQHENDILQIESLKKTKESIDKELEAQTAILESLNTALYQTQQELQREKMAAMNLEKTFLAKFAEAEEKYNYTIHNLTQENMQLRQKIIMKNEEIYEGRSGRLPSVITYEDNSDILEDDSCSN
ncbi:PREDICTED: amyotrophic lateral sclerosis 2 chromosomal region candidate gene 12 protein [Elephantulus edwardii]|uniref:amyotrophic lateral sclerosis 2 chromosomal region candidate gene 12 protein n=1 Tax=Elephantulus edwardii TaxID=28737 RepID=UPI0003F0AC5D|nr:PREDICTED: amyotrophic lateral sclerosis 2 chromosomal region candidate gene 12 protein [Elephantulus edwardii]